MNEQFWGFLRVVGCIALLCYCICFPFGLIVGAILFGVPTLEGVLMGLGIFTLCFVIAVFTAAFIVRDDFKA